ncbi:MAG: hypothetical protein V1714_00900 [Pseudomonadota bacterium]
MGKNSLVKPTAKKKSGPKKKSKKPEATLVHSAPPETAPLKEETIPKEDVTEKITLAPVKTEERIMEKEKSEKPIEKTEEIKIESPPVETKSCEPMKKSKESDPVDRVMKYVIAGFIVLILIIIAVSSSNSKKYYVQAADGGIEIWKGNFAPLGKQCLMQLPGMKLKETLKAAYSKEEALSFVFQYYLQKSDTLLEVTGMPDFEGIKSYLKTAISYAVSDSQRAVARSRINHIDLMLLLYKADVALDKGTIEGAENALKHLEQAASLDLPSHQAELVRVKTDSARKLIASVKAKESEKGQAAKEKKQ